MITAVTTSPVYYRTRKRQSFTVNVTSSQDHLLVTLFCQMSLENVGIKSEVTEIKTRNEISKYKIINFEVDSLIVMRFLYRTI